MFFFLKVFDACYFGSIPTTNKKWSVKHIVRRAVLSLTHQNFTEFCRELCGFLEPSGV